MTRARALGSILGFRTRVECGLLETAGSSAVELPASPAFAAALRASLAIDLARLRGDAGLSVDVVRVVEAFESFVEEAMRFTSRRSVHSGADTRLRMRGFVERIIMLCDGWVSQRDTAGTSPDAPTCAVIAEPVSTLLIHPERAFRLTLTR